MHSYGSVFNAVHTLQCTRMQVTLEADDSDDISAMHAPLPLAFRLNGCRSRGVYVTSIVGGTKLAEVWPTRMQPFTCSRVCCNREINCCAATSTS